MSAKSPTNTPRARRFTCWGQRRRSQHASAVCDLYVVLGSFCIEYLRASKGGKSTKSLRTSSFRRECHSSTPAPTCLGKLACPSVLEELLRLWLGACLSTAGCHSFSEENRCSWLCFWAAGRRTPRSTYSSNKKCRRGRKLTRGFFKLSAPELLNILRHTPTSSNLR